MVVLMLLGASTLTIHTAPLQAQQPAVNPDPEVTWIHHSDPEIALPVDYNTWSDQYPRSWEMALRQEESDLRLQAADTISFAIRFGFPVDEPLVKALVDVVRDRDENPETRTAAAVALVTADAREAAEALAEGAAAGPLPLTLRVDRALAAWDYLPIREVWLKRLEASPPQRSLVESAIESLATVGEPRVVAPLERLLDSSQTDPALRILAARSLAMVPMPQRLERAEAFLKSAGSSGGRADLEHLLGVLLLAREDSPAGIELLDRYCQVTSSAVVAQAMQRLLQVAPARLVARADEFLRSNDGNVRKNAVAALATDPSPRSVQLLGPILNDPVPAVRSDARHHLLVMAADEGLRSEVIAAAEKVLASDQWRALEQAILILAQLDHEAVGERLFALIDHPRHEVYVTACWGLKEMAIEPLRELYYKRMVALIAEVATPKDLERYWASGHLIEAMGKMRHQPAVEDLKRLIPKEAPIHPTARAAAIWALGYLLADSQDAEVSGTLAGRLADAGSIPPESDEVRAMAAISMGRIASPSSLEPLRKWASTEGTDTYIGRRCAWSIELLTGEPIPALITKTYEIGDWFLMVNP